MTPVALEKQAVLPIIEAALQEDVGLRDVTTAALLLKTDQARGQLVVRRRGVVAGLAVAEWTFQQVEPRIRFKPTVAEGTEVHPGKAVAYLEGPARGLLIAERVALNFLGRLCGIATLTRAYVEKVRASGAQIFDTRKTTPTLRLLERYAVAVGGGFNHRMNLSQQILIKDNHLKVLAQRSGATLRSPSLIEQAVAAARKKFFKSTLHPPPSTLLIEVEVTNLQQFRQALAAKADIVLLDNMGPGEIREAVRLQAALSRGGKGRRPILEVSGGVSLQNVGALAALGVDRISVGRLTHSAPALDVSLELIG